ncbi:unnamed protein product [Closterium sp. Naga37s-1]|nr:unnamed protein product [Closterium sp. Naga37s-1]
MPSHSSAPKQLPKRLCKISHTEDHSRGAHLARKCAAWAPQSLAADAFPRLPPLSTGGIRLEIATETLPALAVLHPQIILLLLSRCIYRKVGHLLRSTPFSSLPIREWLGRENPLLQAALDACSMKAGSCRSRNPLVLGQPPIHYGGAGPDCPAVEAALAYLGSITQTSQLLQALQLPSSHPLSALVPPLQGPFSSNLPMHTLLQKCETLLPEDAQTLLAAEQSDPTETWLQHGLSVLINRDRVAALTPGYPIPLSNQPTTYSLPSPATPPPSPAARPPIIFPLTEHPSHPLPRSSRSHVITIPIPLPSAPPVAPRPACSIPGGREWAGLDLGTTRGVK